MRSPRELTVDWSRVISETEDVSNCGEAEVLEVLVRALGPESIDRAFEHVVNQSEGWEVIEQVLRRLKPRRVMTSSLLGETTQWPRLPEQFESFLCPGVMCTTWQKRCRRCSRTEPSATG